MEKKPENAKFSESIRIRLTKNLHKMLTAEAAQKNAGISDMVRQILELYFESKFSDLNILNSSVLTMNRKLKMLENKTELQSLIVLELAKLNISTFPEKATAGEQNERRYEKFIEDLEKSFRTSHRGKLESIVLDIYERGEDEKK